MAQLNEQKLSTEPSFPNQALPLENFSLQL